MLKSKSSTAFSFSYISPLLSPFFSCGKTINKVATVGAVGHFCFFLVRAPRMEILSHANSENPAFPREDLCWMFASWKMPHDQSAPKGLCRNASSIGSWEGGTLPVLRETPTSGLCFLFLCICKVSEGVAETPEKHWKYHLFLKMLQLISGS